MVCLRQRQQVHEITNLNARFGPDLAETMVSIYQTDLVSVVSPGEQGICSIFIKPRKTISGADVDSVLAYCIDALILRLGPCKIQRVLEAGQR